MKTFIKENIRKMLFIENNSNILYHAGDEKISVLDPNKIVGGARANYGYGIYFTDSIDKAKDYGGVLTYMDKNKLKILDTRNIVDDDFINQIRQLAKDETNNSLLSAFYDVIASKLKDQIGKTIDDARKNICDTFRYDVSKAWSIMIKNLGYDAVKNGYEYVIINFDAGNKALISQ